MCLICLCALRGVPLNVTLLNLLYSGHQFSYTGMNIHFFNETLHFRLMDFPASWKPWVDAAIEQAELSLSQGGLPIGAVLVNEKGEIVSRGHNENIQTGDLTTHAEAVCIRKAAMNGKVDMSTLTVVTTMSPCDMCSGMCLWFKIPRVIVCDNSRNICKDGAAHLEEREVEVIVGSHSRCAEFADITLDMVKRQPEVGAGCHWGVDMKREAQAKS